ncbi:MAG: hypothetical protein AAGD12_03825 [Pseudomonadota bacterium]
MAMILVVLMLGGPMLLTACLAYWVEIHRPIQRARRRASSETPTQAPGASNG